MKRFTSPRYSSAAFNIALLVLRVGMGAMMIPHGYNKLMNFMQYKKDFMNFMGIGSTTTLVLVIFAEFFCAALIVLGLLTRFAAIPLIIGMSVALLVVHNGYVWGYGQVAAVFLTGCTSRLLVGPGRIRVDEMISKWL